MGGRWLSVHEEWTVIRGDEEVKESYDYGDSPNEQSAYLRLASSAFDILSLLQWIWCIMTGSLRLILRLSRAF